MHQNVDIERIHSCFCDISEPSFADSELESSTIMQRGVENTEYSGVSRVMCAYALLIDSKLLDLILSLQVSLRYHHNADDAHTAQA